ncbi:MAG: DNA polymerase Y family protein [Betaproteobacteria bacterium]|nr:DNA polymerase Y family protein [Betaproteobacteria bacterium]
MLWIALHLPALSLQIAQRAGCEARPLVISDGPCARPIVFAANAAAREWGVKPGMPVAAARARARELLTLQREPNREAHALESLAGWAYQFTPCVAIQPAQGLLLEVESALRLHRGLARVLARIREEAWELGYHTAIGVAPTPAAAWLFAKARHAGRVPRTCTDLVQLPERLRDIPLALFDWPPDVIRTLAALGVIHIGHCLALPRDGFARRFGEALLGDLDRALGTVPDPRPYFAPPERFASGIEFDFEVTDATALLFPLTRLLKELEGFLRGRGAGVQAWSLTLAHAGRRTSRITLGFAAPERDAGRFTALARERLNRVAPPAPVIGIRIEADQLFPYAARSASWLPEPGQPSSEWLHLIDKLTARLGEEKAYRLQSHEDHRPERSVRRVSPKHRDRTPAVALPRAPRPLWLLALPRSLLTESGHPLCQGRLHLIAGPERIEAGWWDGEPIGRDYYVARNPHGETLWVYRDHRSAAGWYLHGIFA